MKAEEKDAYANFCEEVHFKLKILDFRLARHKDEASKRYVKLDHTLRNDKLIITATVAWPNRGLVNVGIIMSCVGAALQTLAGAPRRVTQLSLPSDSGSFGAEPPLTVAEAGLIAAMGAHLARYKQPKRVVLAEALPRNTMGKVQKAKLREQLADSFARA